MEDYRRIADSIADDIASGRLRPGDRLPPQRVFARQHAIADSTAARVYRELAGRGLTVGEVGRGTFVRASAPPPGPALVEPTGSRIDLELNYPVVPEQATLLADGISPLLRADVLESSMQPIGAAGTPVARRIIATLLARSEWHQEEHAKRHSEGHGERPGPERGNERWARHGDEPADRLENEHSEERGYRRAGERGESRRGRWGEELGERWSEGHEGGGGGWWPEPERVLFAGNGRQAIAAALATLVPPGGRLGVEELTYPVLKGLAARVGVTLVPLRMDEAGLVPAAVEAAVRKAPLKAVYVQPTLHNPLSISMPVERRAELAGVLQRLDVPAIEDSIWSFLRDDLPPLAAFAPERTILVDSLSKRLAPGLSLGFAVVPGPVVPRMAAALRSGGWTPMRFALEAATRWLTDDTARAVARAKQRDAAMRQEIAARCLDGFAVRSDPRSYYCWWELPPPWRADTFVAAAARYGIAVTPAAAFAVGHGHDGAPNAVRLGLASPPPNVLSQALTTLANLARSTPEDLVAE
ncbi:Transcriptional regulator, GntR family domain / Aspartate aminotransferase [[Actinomadura] parvosata subsp. kistnae]|uniref:aminotransferase-like domain-containing protein n=1 Tax=[Actinomadura] parvosata TaxID=1955412 RepID=UPI000D2B4922|nr:PLP-dependent aminotransferase family protein [Nonomuraea sp. ATCC 55076]SPL92640.1 Transcriptional regulator, GntR family domain / Aspartate aminotransferase [Actinomadura parvosata subsp. kistnae]